MQQLNISRNTNMVSTERKNMKTITDVVWNFLCALGQARHAAFLARQGKVNEAKKLYAKTA